MRFKKWMTPCGAVCLLLVVNGFSNPFPHHLFPRTHDDFVAKAVAYGNGRYVAVGIKGQILVSKNGKEWMPHCLKTEDIITPLNYTSKTFSYGGSSLTVIVSTNAEVRADGLRTFEAGLTLAAVAYGYRGFVAVGDQGTVRLSETGETWKVCRPGVYDDLKGIAHANDSYVAVGDNGRILSSRDGLHWNVENSGTTNGLNAVIYVPSGVFVAVGNQGIVLTSSDASNWVLHQTPCSKPLTSIAYGNKTFVAASAITGSVVTSSDGIKWTKQWVGFSLLQGGGGLAFGNGLFVAVSPTSLPKVSRDGIRWESVRDRRPLGYYLCAVVYGNRQFAAVGQTQIMLSTNGTNWNEQVFGPSRLMYGYEHDMMFLKPRGFQVGNHLETYDGQTWTTASLNPISGNVYGNEVVAMNNSSKLIVIASDDGITWRRLNTKKSQSEQLTPPESGGQVAAIKKVNLLVLNPENRTTNKGLEFGIAGEPGRIYRVQASTNLEHWVDLGTFTNLESTIQVVDVSSTNFDRRFYRVVSP